ncbi:hypothetical protein D9613_005783 [Agrocybe pediades]|uniref:Uncharacterized protein n=1 Tax=Agrocybe pediades TaxID=84607 RepID=A0A8H4VPE5_9AGAR|nr:hypothetical protein D9613_005783 [Agrocybe pediades]
MDDHPKSFETAVVTKAVNFALPTSKKTHDDDQEKPKQSVQIDHSSVSSRSSATTDTPFPELHFTYSRLYIFLYALFLLICNLVIPILLFYPLITLTHLTKKTVIGISSGALGLSSCFDSPVRLYRLVRYRGTYGPLGHDVWWHLDFSMWAYTIALLIFAIPLAIAPAIPLFNFFLMSTVMLVGPLGLIFFISLFKPKLPFWCSSDPPGTKMKPAVFYVVEDVASVDFRHGKEFRRTLHERWHASPPFQRLMRQLTIYWTVSAAVYCGVTAAVSWAAPLNFAFAWTLAQLFIWARLSAIGCRILSRRGLKQERLWWEREKGEKVKRVTTSSTGSCV